MSKKILYAVGLVLIFSMLSLGNIFVSNGLAHPRPHETHESVIPIGIKPLPDLEVWALDRDFKTFEVWFRNIGDAEITDFTMHWYVDGEEIEDERSVYSQVLSPGDRDTNVENLAQYIPSGFHTIKFCVNYGDISERIMEITWSNNCMQRTHFFL